MKRTLPRFRCAALVTTLAASISLSGAQQPIEKPSNDEIAKQLANPNTPLATLRLKNLYTFYDGDLPGAGGQSNYSMLFQPSFPFPLDDEGSVLLWRPALPIFFETPVFNPSSGEFDDKTGLGDIAMDTAYGKHFVGWRPLQRKRVLRFPRHGGERNPTL